MECACSSSDGLICCLRCIQRWWAGYTLPALFLATPARPDAVLLAYGLVPFCGAVRLWRSIAAVLIAYGVAVQAVGVVFDDDYWNRTPFRSSNRRGSFWDWSDLQIARADASGFNGTDWRLCSSAWPATHGGAARAAHRERLGGRIESTTGWRRLARVDARGRGACDQPRP